jgi:hypothetical protein
VAARSLRDPRGFAAFTSSRPCSVWAGTDGRSGRKREAERETDADCVSCARHKGMSVHNAADSSRRGARTLTRPLAFTRVRVRAFQ